MDEMLKILNQISDKIDIESSYEKLFYLECKCNYKLIQTVLKWKEVETEYQNNIIRELKTEAARSLYAFANNAIISKIMKSIGLQNKAIPDSKLELASLISKIEVLQSIINIGDKQSKETRALIKVRLKNIENQIKCIQDINA